MRPPPRIALLAALAVSLLAPPALESAHAGSGQISPRDDLAAGVLQELNRIRADSGLRPLRPAPGLVRAAAAHTRSMARHGYFAHVAPGGETFGERIRRFYPRAKQAQSWAAAENLLWASPDIDPQQAVELWLESPSHRAIVLNRRWTEVGIAAIFAAAARGFFGGRQTTILAAEFGVR